MKYGIWVQVLLAGVLLVIPTMTVCSQDGFVATIENVAINSSMQAEVTFLMLDAAGQPLSPTGVNGIDNGGDISVRGVIMAYLSPEKGYMSYSTSIATAPDGSPNAGAQAEQAGYDSGGVWSVLGGGRFLYTFGTVLPADYNAILTHTVSAQLERSFNGKRFVANPVHHFVPDGRDVTELYRVSTTESCNKCHTSIGIHGGARKDYTLCLMCHTDQSVDPDTGNSVEMGEMIHKIHMGHNLPSVQAGTPYQIIGYRQSIHDYSHVGYPQDINNCASCHNGPEGDVYMTKPNRQSCGACHDDVDFAAGVGHIAQADDNACAMCHNADSIASKHTPTHRSPVLKGLNAEILEVRNAAPGQAPSALVKISEDDGTIVAPADLGRLYIVFAGPTSEYMSYTEENIISNTTNTVSEGDALLYTFNNVIPADAQGSYAFAIETRRSVEVNGSSYNESAVNPVFTVAVTDNQPVERRTVVTDAKCNTCHDSLKFHGNLRISMDYCVMCHNPNKSDIGRRGEGVGGGESVSFSHMIHKIHRGHNLTQDYTVYGFGNTAHNYNEILFPGLNQECTVCHVEQPALPLGDNVAAINFVDKDGVQVNMAPTSAVCLSCHDTDDAASHAAPFVSDNGESCDLCHGAGASADIAKYHAFNTFLNVETTTGGTRVPFWQQY